MGVECCQRQRKDFFPFFWVFFGCFLGVFGVFFWGVFWVFFGWFLGVFGVFFGVFFGCFILFEGMGDGWSTNRQLINNIV